MTYRIAAVLGIAAASAPQALPEINTTRTSAPEPFFRGILTSPALLTAEHLDALLRAGATEIVFPVETAAEAQPLYPQLRARGLKIGTWIEVARAPELADLHPEWIASLQGHEDWRRLFPDAPTPKSNEVVKAYPWVPVQTHEGFAVQIQRVVGLIEHAGSVDDVFLNDLQAAPSACGCVLPIPIACSGPTCSPPCVWPLHLGTAFSRSPPRR